MLYCLAHTENTNWWQIAAGHDICCTVDNCGQELWSRHIVCGVSVPHQQLDDLYHMLDVPQHAIRSLHLFAKPSHMLLYFYFYFFYVLGQNYTADLFTPIANDTFKDYRL